MIQSYKLVEGDYRGKQFKNHSIDLKGFNDVLNITQPQIIEDIHRAYLESGADIIETNTFNGTSVSAVDYQMEEAVFEINFEGAQIAKRVANDFTKNDPSKPRFVCGILGPTNRMGSQTSSHRKVAWLLDEFRMQISCDSENRIFCVTIIARL